MINFYGPDVACCCFYRYYKHVSSQPHTLLTRFYGLHRVRVNKSNVRFVVMRNVFRTEVQIHRRYDLKGSTIGRTAGPEAKSGDPNVTLKVRQCSTGTD